jgi:hypothetical protein
MYQKIEWDQSEIDKTQAKLINNQKNAVKQSISMSMYKGYGLGMKGNEVKVILNLTKVQYNVILCVTNSMEYIQW